ncbi:hypothetical protein ElyMa_005025100 [Elysia marginata]|uniref:Mutator-like transposase domain-containing protein n=1 Tax=Elysia marginata TaxID=1093978 RepID=A0AAV4JAY2_9GAST|nr:hypothetical protein ElyMa_005025100 [Elysia marginata]
MPRKTKQSKHLGKARERQRLDLTESRTAESDSQPPQGQQSPSTSSEVELRPSTPTSEPSPSTSRGEPRPSTSREEPCPSTSREEPRPSTLTDRIIIPLSSPLPASPEPQIPLTRSQRKLALFTDENIGEPPEPFITNEATVMASLLSGMGPYCLNNFCEALEMPSIHQKTFNTIAKRLYSQNQRMSDEIFSKAASMVHIRFYSLDVTEEDVIDISVSYDGSWLTQGHKSLIEIGCVIDVVTGLVIDGHVCSLHCHTCAQSGEFVRRETPHRYERWMQEHIASGECTINFQGSSRMMEMQAAEVLWSRSMQRHKLCYTTMVSDGDSKAHTRLLKTKPYGPDEEIQKEDCINHVGKRLGAALQNLVSDSSKRGVTLGGRGRGRLTAEVIRKLQIYYSRAIRAGKTLDEMRRNIMAGIYHGYSTDDLPQHQFCPPGPDSNCFFKKAIGEHHYPTGHKKRIHTPLDFELLHRYLQPIYKRLASIELLKKCQLKTT